MSQNDVFHDFPPFYIPGLFLGDDMRQDGFQSISYHLHYNFVDDITEGYRSEMFGIGDSFFFRNEG